MKAHIVILLASIFLVAACSGVTTETEGESNPVPGPEVKKKDKPIPAGYSEEQGLYFKACEQDSAACHQLADSLRKQNKHKDARPYYEKSCRGGYALSCADLGDILYRGDGLDRDISTARGFLEKGCEGGDMPACTTLAGIYETGEEVEPDHAKAQELFKQACDGGYNYACDFLQ